MYNNNNNGGGSMQNVRPNRFGEAETLKTANAVIDKKSGAVLPIFKTYFEAGGQLYKIEISERKKETKSGNPAMWVKITKKNRNRQGGGGGMRM